MNRKSLPLKKLFVTAFWVSLCTLHVSAQTFPLLFRVQANNESVNLANNSTFNVNVDAAGTSTDVRITVTNQVRNLVELQALPQLLGPGEFTVTPPPGVEFPLRLVQGASFTFTVRFTASSSASVNGQILFNYSELVPSTANPPTPPTAVFGVATLNIVGTAPEIVISYALLPDQNVVPLINGTEIPFGLVPIDSTVQAQILLTNRGSGRGLVNSISVSGARFQASGIPLLPVAIPGGGELRFIVRYAPTEIRADAGTLSVGLPRQSFSYSLAGRGAGPVFVYEILGDTGETPILSGQTLSFPDTRVGERSSIALRVRNTGNANGSIASIGASGASFTAIDLPVIPAVIRPSAFITLGIQFAPTQAGTSAGRLRIGEETFNLSGRGIGSQLLFSYNSADTATSVVSGGSVFFQPTAVSRSSVVSFTVRNAGTTATSLTSIGITDTRNFRIDGLPNLPLRLEADTVVSFQLVFTPINTGQATTSLSVDAQTFVLSGFGSAAPNLPPVLFTGLSTGPVAILEQPTVGLSLAQPFPIPIQGQLSLAVDSGTASPDPSVQFATGGRTVAFSIPANSLEAIFAGGSNRIRLQTGSVAGTISLTYSFATLAGLELTTSAPGTLRLTIAPAAPRLLSAQIADRTATGFSLQISGLTNTRSLTSMELTFTPVTGTSLTSSRIPLNVASESGSWFRSTASQPTGGQFSITIPFTLSGGNAASTSLVNQLQSLSLTLSSEIGPSNSVTANFR